VGVLGRECGAFVQTQDQRLGSSGAVEKVGAAIDPIAPIIDRMDFKEWEDLRTVAKVKAVEKARDSGHIPPQEVQKVSLEKLEPAIAVTCGSGQLVAKCPGPLRAHCLSQLMST
jgi:hypothetical protein